ncbi:MAG: HD domain-containing protein [Nocardioidaceae bacterium]
MLSVELARDLARGHLASSLSRRWLHVRAVADRASTVGARLELEPEVLVSAAWLHDIGYSPQLVDTGFHPLDGARYLRRLGVDERVVCLVAHHSCAQLEADERGLLGTLRREFSEERSATADALWYCDMTVGPDGGAVTVGDRLSEIRSRYGAEDVVGRFVVRAREELVGAVSRTERRLDQPHTLRV